MDELEARSINPALRPGLRWDILSDRSSSRVNWAPFHVWFEIDVSFCVSSTG